MDCSLLLLEQCPG